VTKQILVHTPHFVFVPYYIDPDLLLSWPSWLKLGQNQHIHLLNCALSEEQLQIAKERLAWIECALQAEMQKSAQLSKEIELEKKHSNQLYETVQVERCAWQRAKARIILLKQEIQISAKLKKCHKWSVAVREWSVKWAKEQAGKEYSVHKLLHKGVYTEKTRNLIWLLVQAGCSRESVGQIIQAVFDSAGISVKGNISRRTVSRVVLEGYYAAQVQLGYEMKNAESTSVL
jgi:hypothetical protein